MNFIAVEAPAARVTLAGQPLKFQDAGSRVIAARELLQVPSLLFLLLSQ